MIGTKITWHKDGRVTVEYPAGYNPFSEHNKKFVYLKSGEIIPIYEFKRREWDLQMKYWYDHGEKPPMSLL